VESKALSWKNECIDCCFNRWKPRASNGYSKYCVQWGSSTPCCCGHSRPGIDPRSNLTEYQRSVRSLLWRLVRDWICVTNSQSEFAPWTGYATPAQSSLEKLVPGALDQPLDQTSQSPPEGRHNASHDGSPRRPDGHNPDLFQPKTVRFWAIIICNFLCLFLVALGRTILATAVPRITDEFGALGDIGWYGSAYMLATACAQLVYGTIYKFYDLKR